jgi:hypothetical protein
LIVSAELIKMYATKIQNDGFSALSDKEFKAFTLLQKYFPLDTMHMIIYLSVCALVESVTRYNKFSTITLVL